jgi:hypothetical protein
MAKASLGDIFRHKLTGQLVKIIQIHTINNLDTGKQHTYVVMDGVARPGYPDYKKWGVELNGIMGTLSDLLREYEKLDRLSILMILGREKC